MEINPNMGLCTQFNFNDCQNQTCWINYTDLYTSYYKPIQQLLAGIKSVEMLENAKYIQASGTFLFLL